MDEQNGAVDNRPLAEVLRDQIAARQFTLVHLRDQLAAEGNPVSLATLSYWRSGQRHPDGPASEVAVEALERILGLGPGDLTNRLRRQDPVYPDASLAQQWEESTAAMAAVGIRQRDQLAIRTLHSTMDIDSSGHHRRLQHRMVLQARADRVSEFGLAIGGSGTGEGAVSVAECHGGRVRQARIEQGSRWYAMAIEFDQALTEGDRTILEVSVEMEPGFCTDTRHTVASLTPFREVAVWTRFNPQALPASIDEFTVVDGTESVNRRDVVGMSAYLQRRDFGPGVIGARWRW